MPEENKSKEKTWQEVQKEQQEQAICSHDAPGQQAGAPCIRCGKMLPAKNDAPPVNKTVAPISAPENKFL
jgi:hypothetical protein